MSLTEKLIAKHTWLTRVLLTTDFIRSFWDWDIWLEGQRN